MGARVFYRGLVATVLALLPWLGHADAPWTPGRQFALHESTAGRDAAFAAARREGWQLTIAPSLWMPHTEIDLTVGDLSRSDTLDFSDVVEDFRFGFTTHFEATWRPWTLILDVFYFKLEKETTGSGVHTEADWQELFVELGGTYRLATLPVGRAGRITVEALAAGRLMYVDAELSIGAQLRTRTATLIDPVFGGRIAYHITDRVGLWFRGDAAGFGISDRQSQLTYNLVAGLDWRFTHVASVSAGWRYMRIDIEKGSGASTLDADLSMNGPFLGVNFYF